LTGARAGRILSTEEIMPANLPPQYYELERQFKSEKDSAEKLRLAQELLAMMPKHKGTDKLQAEMKAKISTLKKELAQGPKKHGAAHAEAPDHIEKEGAGQVVLIGPPNSGKSSLLDIFTHARPLVADYPYSTLKPQTGMMPFETISIQLVDTPPISAEQFETYLLGIVRNADLVCLVVGMDENDFAVKAGVVMDRLRERRVILVGMPPAADEVHDPGMAYKKTLLVAHKMLEEGSEARFEQLRSTYPGLPIVATSLLDDGSLENFKRAVFERLNIIRVYTKQIGHEADFDDPIILHPGATVEEAAIRLHKDFAYKLQFAKIWGKGKFDGQRVTKSFVLTDEDIIEFHL
jgi:ribosome-interacting GTPase 1